MNSDVLFRLIDELLPKLTGYAFALSGDQLQAEQMVVDAYTVFVVKEKGFLNDESFDEEDKRERIAFKKYLLIELYKELFDLLKTRSQIPRKLSEDNYLEYSAFFSLPYMKRAIIYLKETQNFSVEEIQEVFCLERHQVLENLYNAKNELLKFRGSESGDFYGH